MLHEWVFLPDHWHCIVAPPYPETISIKSLKQSSMTGISHHRGTERELWQPRLFGHAIRTVKEYLEYIHLNPVRSGLVGHPQD